MKTYFENNRLIVIEGDKTSIHTPSLGVLVWNQDTEFDEIVTLKYELGQIFENIKLDDVVDKNDVAYTHGSFEDMVYEFISNASTQIMSNSGEKAILYNNGEVDLLAHRDDVDVNVLPKSGILFVHEDADNDKVIKLMYPDGTIHILDVWKAKAAYPEVIKVYLTGTTLANSEMFLSL